MKVSPFGIIAAATAFALLGPAAPAKAAPADRTSSRPDLQVLLDTLVARPGPGAIGAIAEVRQGAAVWRGASGKAVRGGDRSAPVDGRFRAGSITKTFTATVVLQLVAEGRLGLSDSVQRWLPGLVPGGAHISVQDLLQHTTGLPEYTNDLFYGIKDPNIGAPKERFRTWTPAELVRVAARHLDPQVPLNPDPEYQYSNTNYIVLGMVIEKVTGRPYATAVQQRILRPLGLRGTQLPGAFPFIVGPHSRGYVVVPEQVVPAGQEPAAMDITVMNPSVAGAAGEIISTTADLNLFYRALFSGRLLPAGLLQEMMTPRSPRGYAWGLESSVLDNAGCGRVYGHAGGAPGYGTVSFHSADGDRQVTISWTPWINSAGPALFPFLKAALCS